MKVITAYTDGSACVKGGNKGRSGFGTYFPDLFGEEKFYSKGYSEGKTGQMEVTALLYAIRAIPKETDSQVTLTVYSDSEYVVKTFTENRLRKWISNNWISYGQEIKNRELWENIVEGLNARRFMRLEMIHIRSHQVEKEKDADKKALLLKDPHIIGNRIADYLANYKRFIK